MGQFLYFIPGPLRLPDQIRELNIPGLRCGDGSIATRDTASPPGAPKGFLAWIDRGPIFKVDPDQRWFKVPAGSNPPAKIEYWVGIGAKAPSPSDLLRPNPIGGKVLQLASGEWRVPFIRMLPMSFGWSAEGRLEEIAKAEYESVFERAGHWLDLRCGLAGKMVQDAWIFALVADILALNYRISQVELAVMKWIDTQDCMLVLDAAIDLDALIEAGKEKKTSETGSQGESPSTPGGEDGRPGTARP